MYTVNTENDLTDHTTHVHLKQLAAAPNSQLSNVPCSSVHNQVIPQTAQLTASSGPSVV